MEKIITKDGSITYYNDRFGEHYHSISGAKEEAIEKHVRPALEFLGKNGRILPGCEIVVLDFCFGLGYNSIAFIEFMRAKHKNVRIKIIGIDNDIEIIHEGKRLFRDFLVDNVYNNDDVSFSVEIDDCRKGLERIDMVFDVCFFDPFSPKKCPELWSKEVFGKIYDKMKSCSVLTTYSCSRQARKNMEEVGFIINDGPCVGRKAPSTIAVKEGK